MHRPIFIPVETFNRELDSRLFLAARLATSKKRVFVGKHGSLTRLFPHSKGAIYLGKSLVTPFFTSRLDELNQLHQAHGAFIHLDTEGAVFPGDEDDWRETLRSRIDPARLDGCDTICTWGEFQAEYYRSDQPPPTITPTGEPRFDLYKEGYRAFYDAKVRELRQRFGDFVLINTSLAKANNQLGIDYAFSPRSGYRAHSEEGRDFVLRSWERQTLALVAFVKLIHRLSNMLSGRKIVVRPHPSENQQFYHTVLAGLDNVFVIHEGPVAPWLLAAEAMIHDGCTTAVEAYFANAAIINYQVAAETAGAYLANSLGRHAHSEDEVLELLATTSRGDGGSVPEKARQLLQNFETDAIEALNQAVESTVDRLDVAPSCPTDEVVQRVEGRAFNTERAKRILRPLSRLRMKHNAYARSKFPGLKQPDIEFRLKAIERVTDVRLKFKIFSEDLLVIGQRV
jgi:surface carbohydrate biosynthesis protein